MCDIVVGFELNAKKYRDLREMFDIELILRMLHEMCDIVVGQVLDNVSSER
jgi:hypothetical protein